MKVNGRWQLDAFPCHRACKSAWEDTESYHGTHVTGTVAAARDGKGIVGVAPGVRMASVKVVNDDGYIYPEYAICGFVWAAEKNMDVTNNSYYVDPFEFWCGDQAVQAPAMEAVRRAVDYATGKGVVHAAAAGNSSYDLANKTTSDTSPNDTTPIPRRINSTGTAAYNGFYGDGIVNALKAVQKA